MTQKNGQNGNGGDLAIAGNNAVMPSVDMSKDNDIMSLMLDAQKYDMCFRLAKIIASNKLMPDHLIGDEAVCFQVVVQSMQWGLSPFVVASKTYSIGKKLAYEAQLVSALVNKFAPTQDRLNFEYFGPWDEYIASGLKRDFENKVGVKVWATLRGEDKPRELEVKMSSVGIRNSTNWKNDPKQQICYVAVQRWSRLYCPEVILGVYSNDEMPDNSESDTPAKSAVKEVAAPAEQLKGLLKGEAESKKTAQPSTPMEPAETKSTASSDSKLVKPAKSAPKQKTITDKQRKFLFTVLGNAKVKEDYFREGLKMFFGYESTKDILESRFQEILHWIEKGCPEIEPQFDF